MFVYIGGGFIGEKTFEQIVSGFTGETTFEFSNVQGFPRQ